MSDPEEEHCDVGDCPLCRGDLPPDLVAMIKQAAAQVGPAMTADEFAAWLDSVGATSSA